MSARPPTLPVPYAEATPIGPQTLAPGVAPTTPRDRMQWRAAQPLESAAPQRVCDHGLFDLAARIQLDLFAKSRERP